MPGSLRLGGIAEIDIYAHLSWFIILVLLTWSLASDWFAQLFPGWAPTTYWIAACISALLPIDWFPSFPGHRTYGCSTRPQVSL